MMCLVVTSVLWAVVQAAVPLTAPQRVQLDSATDFDTRIDQGALYPLLKNALQWQDGIEAGATIPDYSAILKAPELHRGELFLIEGLFAGVPRGGTLDMARLTRAGPWDDKLQQWVVVVDQGKDEVAVVYLTNPPDIPRAGAKLRLLARFYKVLADKDRNGRATNYLTFVGKSALVKGGLQPKGSRKTITPLLGALLLLAGVWYMLRRKFRAKPLLQQRRHKVGLGADDGMHQDESDRVDLPKDPAEALNTMRQLHQESE